MTLSELELLLSAFDPSCDPVRLMGGEPTLHSHYPEIIKLLKNRGFYVVVFTNGLHKILRNTPQLPDKILLNLNDWTSYSIGQQLAIRANLSALGERIGLAYTILRPVFDLSMHRHLILEEGLLPAIRLGLAQPVIGGDNAYLSDVDLPEAHRAVVHWAKAFSDDGIRLSLDCGFMRCYFSDADIEDLVRAGTVLNFECLPTLDVGPGLQVWRCFAFSGSEGVPWGAFGEEGRLREWFTSKDAHNGVECIDCVHRVNNWCKGGCLARSMNQSVDQLALRHDGINLEIDGIETL